MNISPETLDILRNFSSINSGLTVKEGNELKTVSAMKNIYAKAIVEENFEKEHSIYDLSEYLGAISLFDTPDFQFNAEKVIVSEGGNSVQYYYADPQMVISPQKEINMPALLKLSGCGLLYAMLFLILQSTFGESFASPFWTGRLQELLDLPPISTQEKVLLLWGQGMLNTLILLPLFLFFFREKVELIVVFGSLSFVVAVFSPAFANFQRIEPLLLVDQVFIGFCLHFLFVTGTVFCFGRNKK